jgi:hypothetical protein
MIGKSNKEAEILNSLSDLNLVFWFKSDGVANIAYR